MRGAGRACCPAFARFIWRINGDWPVAMLYGAASGKRPLLTNGERSMSRARLVPPLLAILMLAGAAGAGIAQAAPETKPAEPPPAAAEPSSPMRQPGDA